MNAAELSSIIERDLSANEHSLAWGGRPIRECLVEPEQKQFSDSFNGNRPVQLWLVFEEDPVARRAYKVVYSEEDSLFGLAVAGQGRDVLIGFYGGFVETLQAM